MGSWRRRIAEPLTPGLSLEFHYFFTRTLWFAHLARAMVAFPGGFGTLDEVCEILTLAQTQKLARPIPVLLHGRSYWQEIINFDALLRHGMIGPEDLELFRYVESPTEALAALKDALSAELARATPAFAETSIPCCAPEEELGRTHPHVDCRVPIVRGGGDPGMTDV